MIKLENLDNSFKKHNKNAQIPNVTMYSYYQSTVYV